MQKILTSILALLTVLCLLAGCAASGTPDPAPAGTGEAPVSTEPASPQTDAALSTEAAAPVSTEPDAAAPTETGVPGGEPEGWEEEWPEEYPVEEYQLLEGAIRQSGELNKYRYLQLDGAEGYMDLAADYVREALACGDSLTMREDSPHDGYANWFMESPKGNASVSGSGITGRFTFSLYPGFERILEMTEASITDRAAMEAAARAFAERFAAITGPLELVKTEEEPQSYYDERGDGFSDVTVPALLFTFRSNEFSELRLPIQEGAEAPVTCGDSTLDDLSVHCFVVTVWPDGTVVRANNYITRAELVPDGTVRMPDAGDVPELVSYLSSMTEHDVLVIESLSAESFGVYFGYAAVDPVITLNYHFASDPAEHLSTAFSVNLFEH